MDTFLNYLDGDRVIYTFVLTWVVASSIWVVLDWLGNPSRGAFRPKGERYAGTWREGRAARRRMVQEDDAAVRTTLRDAYGVSSLQTGWTRDREARVLDSDDLLVRNRPAPTPTKKQRRFVRLPELRPEELIVPSEPVLATYNQSQPIQAPQAILPRGRWHLGLDPLMLSAGGASPTVATVRSRVWKNHANEHFWGTQNQERMRTGKPPRRTNPGTGKIETAAVDRISTRPYWKSAAVDPFGDTT
ncbi:MAG: hypothetical protein HOH36_08055 [Acidimicrobiaceae bacterium]|jgi:hypothetical protein|nr:hypothetical protein [Acidimicrobiaceae bacterium]